MPGRAAVGSERRINPVLLVGVLICTGLGLVFVTLASNGSREGTGGTYAFFWIGLLLAFTPTTLVAIRKNAHRHERLICVLLLGHALYLVKILGSSDAFTFTDEFVHLRNTQDILLTGHLFAFNPLLPTASYYPGLAALTAGFTEFTGLTPFASGLLLMSAARILLLASLFHVAERLTGSDRAAAAASLLYAANPMFLFWSAAFAYENLALPLAAFAVWWIGRTRAQPTLVSLVVSTIAILAVTASHHVAGFALSALLVTWWMTELFVRRASRERKPQPGHRSLGLLAVFSSIVTVSWLLWVAQPAAHYLFTDNFIPALRQTVQVLLGEVAPRRLYASGGYSSPAWETVAGATAVVLVLLALPFAIYRAWSRREHAPMLVAIAVALAYPLSLAPRLAPTGVAISGRSTEYVYFGVACVIGMLATDAPSPRLTRRFLPAARPAGLALGGSAIAALLMTVVFVGNVTIGTAFYQRLPEARNPSGYPWSVQPDVVAAAGWAHMHLGRNQPFGANAIDSLALATYGAQDPVSPGDVWPIFFSEQIDSGVVDTIRETGVRFLLINQRMTRGVPATPGYYFGPYEPNAGQYEVPFPAASLAKFSTADCMDVIYRSAAVSIVDVTRIRDGSCSPVAPVAKLMGRVRG